MSELENIARHIIRHEEERQVEKIKLESEIKALQEVLEHGISTEFVEDEVIYIYSPKTAHDMREKLEENYKQLHAQLTIPQSIADEFDQIYEDTEEYQKNVAQMFSSMQPYFVLESYPEILHWLEDDVKNTNVVLAYLAGKALGVDLVKVVEG